MTGQRPQVYKQPGPVGGAYIDSIWPQSIIMGPGGSGKTFASAYKGPHLATTFFPVCRDGVVRVKLTVLRTTYRDMARTALESWHNEMLFPEKHPWTVSYTGGIDRPTVHKLRWDTLRNAPGGGKVRVPVEFAAHFTAIGDAAPEQFAKGFETSFVWPNEVDLFAERIPGLMFSRTGRYPGADSLSPADLDRAMRDYLKNYDLAGVPRPQVRLDDSALVLPRLLWGDCNPPDFDNWVVKNLIEEPEKHPLTKLFRQPGGLSPQAENRIGKPRSAYEDDLRMMTENDARRYVHGEPGFALDGKPVYAREFALQLHRADENLKPVPGLPLCLGLDAGGSPAAVILQFMPNGQARVLMEICAEPGTGPSRFGEMLLECLIAEFPKLPVREAWADPSSWYGADRVNGELSWVEIVSKTIRVPILPAPSQEPGLRQDAVRHYLSRLIDGATAGLVIDPRCRRLIGGFAAHYKLTKQATGGGTDKLAIAKNEYSHIHDALQYALLGHRGRAGAISDASSGRLPGNVTPIGNRVTFAKDFSLWS